MERIEEFTKDNKDFIHLDFSGFRTCEEFEELTEQAKSVIANYSKSSLFAIVNISDVRLNSCIKSVFLDFIHCNAPYIRYSAIIGIDGIKKMMTETVIKQSTRKNFLFAFTKDQAIELIQRNNY